MPNGNGKTSPFNPDGRSGAVGNGSPGSRPFKLFEPPPQRYGSLRNPASVPAGGPVLKLDPPSNRQGLIGTTADPNQRRPFRLNADPATRPPSDDSGNGIGSVGSTGDDDDGQDD